MTDQRRQGRLLLSRALARAAANGAGTDGTVEKIGTEGESRALNELFIGEKRRPRFGDTGGDPGR